MTLTQKDLDEIETRLSDSFATKEDLQQLKSDLINKLDSILKEILASRQEQIILAHHSTDHEDRLQNIENKLSLKTI